MKPSKKLFWILALAGLCLLFSCSKSTTLKYVDARKYYEPLPIASMMVVGVARNYDNRVLFENVFTDELESRGVKATPSCVLFPSGRVINADQVEEGARRISAQAVLMTHLVGERDKTISRPGPAEMGSSGSAGGAPMGTPGSAMGLYYKDAFQALNTPGYFTQHRQLLLRTVIYDAKTGQLIWRADSGTLDQSTLKKTIRSMCDAVMKSLQKDKFVGKKSK